MRVAIALMALVALMACSPGYEQKHYPILPAELQDCKFYSVSDGGSAIKVVRCPNSQTSTTWTQQAGKTSYQRSSVVIERSCEQ